MQDVTQTCYQANRLRYWSNLINKLNWILAAIFVLTASTAFAQAGSGLPGEADAGTVRTQNMVEALFEAGEYERAFTIYKEDLAPIGDKYAQYMIGFMYLTGTGVDEDPVLASAWYRLAAESTYPELLEVRDQVMNGLTDIDRIRSDQLFLQIRREYSDAVLLLDLIRQDYRDLDARTGSRLSGNAGSVTIFDPRTGRGVSGDEFFRRLNGRIESRLERLDKLIGLDDYDLDPDDLDMNLLTKIVHDWIETINDI